MDAIKLLEWQHDEVDTLFTQYGKAEDADEKLEVFIELADTLADMAPQRGDPQQPGSCSARMESTPIAAVSSRKTMRQKRNAAVAATDAEGRRQHNARGQDQKDLLHKSTADVDVVDGGQQREGDDAVAGNA